MNPNYCPTCQSPIALDAPGGFCTACLLRDAEEVKPMGKHAAPTIGEISTAFPRFEVLEFIGQGGMGFVYKARQPGLDRVVALKILSPALGADPAFEERFSREARTLGKLQHPNIVTVFEHGEEGGFFFLLMEFVDGINLRQAMAAGRFSPEQALAVVPGICDALQAAHAQGICHRDIKPENVLLDHDGKVRIVDFGIALMAGESEKNFTLTGTGGALGSVAYMSPEQHERPHDVDHRADIYSLGVVFYEMLTGELPLGRFPAPSEKVPVNARVDEIVLRTLEKDREFRQQTAEEVKTEVAGVGGGGSASNPEKSQRSISGLSRFIIGALALCSGGMALGGLGSLIKNQVIFAVGGALFAVGFLGGLWSLWEMKKGRVPSTGRKLLIAFTVAPMSLGIIVGIYTYSLSYGSFPRREGGLLIGCVMILGVACPLFWLVLYLGRPLEKTLLEMKIWQRTLGLVLGLALITAGGFYAKIHDGKWPLLGCRSSYEINFPESSELSDAELTELVQHAAGDYKDDYLLEVDRGRVKVTVASAGGEGSFSETELSRAHVQSFVKRFGWLVPVQRIPNFQAFRMFHIERVTDRNTAQSLRTNLAILVSLGAFLICLVGGRQVWWVVISGSIFFVVLALLPVWGNGSKQPRFVSGLPLAFLNEAELPEPDFSTPESAVRSFHDAANLGRYELVRRGASQALRSILDQGDEWKELMSRTGRVKTSGTKMDESRGVLMVRYSSMTSGGRIWVVKEEGEWRVDSLNYVTDSRGSTGPFTPYRTRPNVKWIVSPTVTEWVLNGAEEEVKLSGEMKADVKKLAGYSVLLVHVGGHPVFMVIGRGFVGNQSTVGRGGILSGSVSLGSGVDFEVPSGNKATINSRAYNLTQGRVFYLESGSALTQFAKHPTSIGSDAAFAGLVDDIFSESSPGYVVKSLIASATNGNLGGFRRRLSRSFLAEMDQKGGESSVGDFEKVKFSKVTRIGSKDADVVVTTKSGKKRNVTFVMVLEDGRWKLDGYGR